MSATETITCERCGIKAPRRGPWQKYCLLCSQVRSKERHDKWYRDNPLTEEQKQRLVERERVRKKKRVEIGDKASRENAKMIDWLEDGAADLIWLVRIATPFSYAASKNHIYTPTKKGHVALRQESKEKRKAIATRLKAALKGRRVAHNKLWLDIFVQKPNHKGDAVNVVDLVCDAVKDAIPELDDRWYSIRRLDWEIVKTGGRLFVGVGQTTEQDHQVCSLCGGVKPLGEFSKNRNAKLGVGRECKPCRRTVGNAGRRS